MDEIPRWFLGARLNYAENLLRFNDDRIAIYSCSKLIMKNFSKNIVLNIGEGNSSIKKMTFAELNENVRRYRAALQHVGVTVGDRVVGTILKHKFLNNII
jgi:acetoacetyl-CoA synthetase